MLASDHARFLAQGGFTLNGSGTPEAKKELGRACRWLRHFVRTETDGSFSQAYSKGHVSWAQQCDMGVHSVVGDIRPGHMSGWDAPQFRQHVYDWLFYLATAGVVKARIEVGNEQNNAKASNWLTTTFERDIAFAMYTKMYAAASDAMMQFKAERPELDYMLGGTAASTGGWFTFRVAQWARENNHIMDFASWHWYGLTRSFEALRTDILAIKTCFPGMPVCLTEVGYDPFNRADHLNNTAEAAACVRDLLINAQCLQIDDILWLTTNNPTGLGIYLDNEATELSRIGDVALGFMR